MIRNIRLASLLVLIPTLGVTALPSIASAGVRQVVPATVCQLHGQALETGSNLAGYESLSYSQHGAVINNHSSKYLHVVCPITRFSNDRATIRIYPNAQNPAFPLKCRINSNNPFGTSAYHTTSWGEDFVTTGTNDAPWWFHQVPQHNTSSTITHYTVFCQIPPKASTGQKSSVGSFIIQE